VKRTGAFSLVAGALWAFSIGSTEAAQITKQTLDDPPLDLIVISGPIQPGDEARFRAVASTTGQAIVILSSEGGNTMAGVEIGKAIRLAGFPTAVPSNTLCASACALIWLAGTPRFAEDDSHVGFHASYVVVAGHTSESGVGNALVGAYLNQLGLSQRAIVFVTSAPPEGIEWLTAEKAQQVGIEFLSLKKGKRTSTEPDRLGVAEEGYDPITTVRKFYKALSEADGTAAAALVIPEKRGIGPFNERNISEFFGNMQEPLRVTSVTQATKTLVKVEYHYVYANGRACDGRSEVTTDYVFGKTLIQRIRANC